MAHTTDDPGGHGDAADVDRAGGLAVDHGHRRLPAQCLLDDGVEEGAVPTDAVEDRSDGDRRARQAVAEGPKGRLRPGREQQTEKAVDVLVAQPFAVDLGRDDVGDEVVGGMGLALLHQGSQVLAHGPGGGGGDGVVLRAPGDLEGPAPGTARSPPARHRGHRR